MEHNYKENKALKFYADALHISERHLNRMLKETTSMTAAEMIRGRTVLEAKRLLGFTNLNIAEIAWHLGYDDNSYFTKIFKKETGLTPLTYRASMS
ncbi:helix-turn-helix domain-containing protein [Chryseobacterium wanjuense]